MKHLSFFILLFLAVPVLARSGRTANIDKPDYLALPSDGVTITRVKTTDKATTLYFHAVGDSAFSFSIPSCSYLVDESGRRYKMTGCKNVEAGKDVCPGKKGLKFSVSFLPLPDGTERFDMIAEIFVNAGRYYYGIREGGLPLLGGKRTKQGCASPAVAKVFPDDVFMADSMIVSGRFHDTGNYSVGGFRLEVAEYHDCIDSVATNMKFGYTIIVDSTGCFSAKIPVLGPSWTSLYALKPKSPEFLDKPFTSATHYAPQAIPVVLYPGDNLHMDIYDYAGGDRRIEYKSGKTDFGKLLNNCPMAAWLYTGTTDAAKAGKCAGKETAERRMDILDSLALYLSSKYRLGDVETQMLRTEYNVGCARDAVDEANRVANRMIKPFLGGGPKVRTLSDTLPYIIRHSGYDVISRVKACDNTFLVVPSYKPFMRELMASSLSRYGSLACENDRCETKEERILCAENKVMGAIRAFRHKPAGTDALFEQAYLMMSFRDKNNLLPGVPDARLLEMRSRRITLPVFSGMLKLVREHFFAAEE